MISHLAQNSQGFDVVEDNQISISTPMGEFTQVQDVRSLVTFPIFFEGRMSEFISLAYLFPTEIDEPAERLYSSLNDQIRLSIQAQRLLNITRSNAEALPGKSRPYFGEHQPLGL